MCPSPLMSLGDRPCLLWWLLSMQPVSLVDENKIPDQENKFINEKNMR